MTKNCFIKEFSSRRVLLQGPNVTTDREFKTRCEVQIQPDPEDPRIYLVWIQGWAVLRDGKLNGINAPRKQISHPDDPNLPGRIKVASYLKDKGNKVTGLSIQGRMKNANSIGGMLGTIAETIRVSPTKMIIYTHEDKVLWNFQWKDEPPVEVLVIAETGRVELDSSSRDAFYAGLDPIKKPAERVRRERKPRPDAGTTEQQNPDAGPGQSDDKHITTDKGSPPEDPKGGCGGCSATMNTSHNILELLTILLLCLAFLLGLRQLWIKRRPY